MERRLGLVEPPEVDQRGRFHRSPVEDARAATDAEEPGGAQRLDRQQDPGRVATGRGK